MSTEAFGEALRRIRRERGVSLRWLSAKAHVDFGYLSKIENGHRRGTPEVARAVDTALRAGGELVAIVNSERAERVRTAVPFDPMRRRTLIRWGLAAPVVAGLGGLGLDPARIGKVGANDAARLRAAAVRLRTLGHRHGGESLWQAAHSWVGDGYAMLEHGTYSEAVGQQLLKATGRMQMCSGWLAFDTGRHEVARSCYTEALALARQAGDPGVEMHALVNLAFQSNALGRPREALRFVEAAERVSAMPGSPARASAMPQMRRAIASALSADPISADKAMACARKVLDRDSDKPIEDWCSFLSPAELDGVEATCAIAVGRPRYAATLLEQAIAAHDDGYARNRALYRVRLAHARLDAKTVDGAVAAADAALDDLSDELASWSVDVELDAVAERLARFPGVSGVADFLARYASMAR
jgi:transcriptional regulator with XRE-family HTH domain/tetratricopeptide (TPR) repeat protein